MFTALESQKTVRYLLTCKVSRYCLLALRGSIQANTRRSPNAGIMLAQRCKVMMDQH